MAQEEKKKTYTEEEFNKRLVDELNKQPRVSYSVAHGYMQQGRCPKLEVRVEGGDPQKSHELLVAVEALILDYAKNNPPSGDSLPNPRHYLPADAMRTEPN